MTIDLTPEQERRIDEALRSGAYENAAEFVDRAIAELCAQERWYFDHRDEIAEQIEIGYAEAQRGELLDVDEVRARLEIRKQAWLAGKNNV